MRRPRPCAPSGASGAQRGWGWKPLESLVGGARLMGCGAAWKVGDTQAGGASQAVPRQPSHTKQVLPF